MTVDVGDSDDPEGVGGSEPYSLSDMSAMANLRTRDKWVTAGITTWYMAGSIAILRFGLVPLAEKFAGHSTTFNATVSVTFSAALAVTNGGTLWWGFKQRNENKRLQSRNQELERTARQGGPRKKPSRR